MEGFRRASHQISQGSWDSRGIKVFLKLDAGITRGEVPDPNRPIEARARRMLDELLRWAGAEPAGRSTHRSLSLEEVVSLEREKHIEIGAHTVTHPVLSALPVASQREEIQRSKVRLEEILNRPVTSFSYPHGDLSAETADIVREAGFACACSARADVVRPSTRRFWLPRVHIPNWNGEKFARWLSERFRD